MRTVSIGGRLNLPSRRLVPSSWVKRVILDNAHSSNLTPEYRINASQSHRAAHRGRAKAGAYPEMGIHIRIDTWAVQEGSHSVRGMPFARHLKPLILIQHSSTTHSPLTLQPWHHLIHGSRALNREQLKSLPCIAQPSFFLGGLPPTKKNKLGSSASYHSTPKDTNLL